jgi:GT2 family glycosyltransferase
MGISKNAFEASGGFGNIHPGEDPDLTIRLWDLGFKSAFIEKAFVYHKRRISWGKFYQQVHKFGLVRPILNNRYPRYNKLVYWFPSLFVIGMLFALILVLFKLSLPLVLYAIYFILIFIFALFKEKNLKIAFLSIYAVLLQFVGYGSGYLISYCYLNVLRKDETKIFPHLFFKA